MSTLTRYVVGRFILAFLGSLLILALVVLVVDTLLYLQTTLEAESSVWGVIRSLLMRMAAVYLPYLIPVATFTGALFALGSAARAREIVAMKAGGVSPIRAVMPIFGVALLLSGASFVLNETVGVGAAAALQTRTGDPGELAVGDGTIWSHTGRFVYHIVEPTAPDVGGASVTVYERNAAGRLIRTIHAVDAEQLGPELWRFEAATIRRFDPDTPGKPPEIEQHPDVTLELVDDRRPPMLRAQLETLPVWTLAKYAGGRRDSPGLQSLVHQRLSAPLLVLLFALLAVPLGLRVEQTRSLAGPALQGVALLFVFLLAREYTTTLTANPLLAAAAPWTVLLLFGTWGAVSLYRTPT